MGMNAATPKWHRFAGEAYAVGMRDHYEYEDVYENYYAAELPVLGSPDRDDRRVVQIGDDASSM